MVTCPQCGSQVRHQRFCSNCGAALPELQVSAAASFPQENPSAGQAQTEQVGGTPTYGAMSQPNIYGATSTAGGAYPPSLDDAGGAGDSKRRKRRVVIIGAVVAALLVIGGGLWAVWALYLSKTGGAESPEAAVTTMADALSGEDMVQAALLLAPDEVEPFIDANERLRDKVMELIPDRHLAEGAEESLLDGLSISVDKLDTKVRPYNNDLARVELTKGVVTVKYDVTEVDESIQQLFADAAEETFDWSFDLAELDDPVYIMSVRRDGGWYLSPMFTLAELASQESSVSPTYSSVEEFERAPGGETPEEAGELFLDGVAEAVNESSVGPLAEILPAPWDLLFDTYGETIDTAMDSSGLEAHVNSVSFTSETVDGRTVITPTDMEFTLSDGSHTLALSADEKCVSAVKAGDRKEFCGGGAPASERLQSSSFYSGDYWESLFQGVRLVVVETETGWKVDPVATLFGLVIDTLDPLTQEDVAALALAATDRNSGVVAFMVDPQAAKIGNTLTMPTDQMTSYEVTVPEGKALRVRCVDDSSDCAVGLATDKFQQVISPESGGIVAAGEGTYYVVGLPLVDSSESEYSVVLEEVEMKQISSSGVDSQVGTHGFDVYKVDRSSSGRDEIFIYFNDQRGSSFSSDLKGWALSEGGSSSWNRSFSAGPAETMDSIPVYRLYADSEDMVWIVIVGKPGAAYHLKAETG